MNNRLVFLHKWLEKRGKRERLYLFVGGFASLYLIFYLFFLHPIKMQKNVLMTSIAAMQSQQVTIEQKIDKIHELIKSPIFLQMMAQQQKQTEQLAKMQEKIDSLKPTLFSAEELPILTKSILNQQRDNVALISLVELPAELWATQKPTANTTVDNTAADQALVLDGLSGVYQHTQQIEFRDDYFNTINYLQRLEKISKNIYWDSMDYKVLQYPKADVVIKFHVLSLQKS